MGHEEVCRVLIAAGADVNAALANGRHPLGEATVRGHEEVVRLLLANGADVNLCINDYGTALHAAARYGHPALADILLTAGADVDAISRLGTPLHLAAFAPKGVESTVIAEIVKKLIDHGADVHIKHELTGQTALHAVAMRGRTEAARLLIDAGADVSAKDNRGRTPLAYAQRRYESREVAELLRQHGAEEPSEQDTVRLGPVTR
jgi:ankyrin repeat protein